MVRKVLATVAVGQHLELFDLAINNLRDYADKFEYELAVCFKRLDSRPPAWTKILHILSLMENFDEIFWIDSDAIILNDASDLAEEISFSSDLSWVHHSYEGQSHPNSGIMYIKVNSRTKKLFNRAYEQVDLIDHPWWDQAALMRVLGYESSVWPIGKIHEIEDLKITEQRLTKEWNSIRSDPSRSPRIRHFAGEPFWLRKLLMAEYANPFGNYQTIIQSLVLKMEMNKQLQSEFDELQSEFDELQSEFDELQSEFEKILNSRSWKMLSTWRTLRSRKSF